MVSVPTLTKNYEPPKERTRGGQLRGLHRLVHAYTLLFVGLWLAGFIAWPFWLVVSPVIVFYTLVIAAATAILIAQGGASGRRS